MAEGTIYTRVYSERSAGKLSSGKKPTSNALTHAELLGEFLKHANRHNREPTALISVSSRIIDTIQRAFKKYYAYDESPEDIWIAFIKAPATGHESPTSLHAAQHLAEECEPETPGIFRYEYIFEWVIPGKYVLHKVSLQTLMDRGLDWEKYVFAGDDEDEIISGDDDDKIVSTSKLRKRVAAALLPQQAWRDPWGVGICLTLFAQKFGARAPLDWVAHQLFFDCVSTKVPIDGCVVVVKKYGRNSSNMVDFDFFSELEDGIDTALHEWWLMDTEFCLDLNEFDEWRAEEEHGIIQDESDFWEAWYYPDFDGIAEEPSERERLARDEAWDKLSAKHEKIWQAIEARAVAIGL
ncbi:uncharacterized protein TrAFT101_000722 [Trichoderma asperellum]|uniref:uncharacterized protein n=1 Tax=Trichoderma asperellum TaxID=101201 RepID=UPI00332CCE49|nr:hypothetical protein TrAFT101_000722 [Trichoderma asperellum]